MRANRTKSLLMNTEECSNHESLPEQLKSYLGGKNLTQKLSRGLTASKDVRTSAQRGIANWETKRQSNCTVATPCLDDHNFKKEELETVGEIVRRMFSNCLEILVLGSNW